ncbi:MAG: RluA family pseudouridine synthase [Candidatus Shikimatogenerans sp. JK-2022]|nr:RluA family pseudouridine synthase [Candidatus Shikimatogenerans bostrichidophilus]
MVKKRLDKYLYYNFFKKKISRNKIQKYIKNGFILLNNKKIKKNKIFNKKDKINIIKKINFFEKKKTNIFKNKNLNIKIHYENLNFLIINKEPGLVVHPGNGYYKNTLINWLKYYFFKKNIINILNYEKYKFGLLHRLDKETSGLLIIAKNIFFYKKLKKQFLKRIIKKKYLALIWGIPNKKKNIIKNNILRNPKNRIKMTVLKKQNLKFKKYSKFCITKYKVLKSYKILSLVECNLKTGRTHQIRVHFKYLGHPVFNDKLYGGNKIYNKKYKNLILKLFKILPRQALHAYYLKFKDPKSNKKKKFITKLPEDIKNCINLLKKKFN